MIVRVLTELSVKEKYMYGCSSEKHFSDVTSGHWVKLMISSRTGVEGSGAFCSKMLL